MQWCRLIAHQRGSSGTCFPILPHIHITLGASLKKHERHRRPHQRSHIGVLSPTIRTCYPAIAFQRCWYSHVAAHLFVHIICIFSTSLLALRTRQRMVSAPSRWCAWVRAGHSHEQKAIIISHCQNRIRCSHSGHKTKAIGSLLRHVRRVSTQLCGSRCGGSAGRLPARHTQEPCTHGHGVLTPLTRSAHMPQGCVKATCPAWPTRAAPSCPGNMAAGTKCSYAWTSGQGRAPEPCLDARPLGQAHASGGLLSPGCRTLSPSESPRGKAWRPAGRRTAHLESVTPREAIIHTVHQQHVDLRCSVEQTVQHGVGHAVVRQYRMSRVAACRVRRCMPAGVA